MKDVRDAAAHPYDRVVGREEVNAHRVAGKSLPGVIHNPKGKILIGSGLDGRRFISTVWKKYVGMDVTHTKLKELESIFALVEWSLRPVARYLDECRDVVRLQHFDEAYLEGLRAKRRDEDLTVPEWLR